MFRMRLWLFVSRLLGLTCLAFAWWGLNTVAGRRTYDEMAGMIPLCAGVAGVFLIVVSILLAFLLWWRRRAA